MKWHQTTPYSFRGCHVIGYTEDHNGAWLIEHDPNLLHQYVLYRFDNDNARAQWQLIDTYHTAWGARRRAERDSSKVPA